MRRLTDAEFAAARAYLVQEAGLVFDETRRAGLSSTFADRLATCGEPDVMTYLAGLRTEQGKAERQSLLDAVTVQETHFFRNPPQMEALRRRILPELLRRAAGRARPLTIWSAGCSTGEEAYTLAMLLLELSPMLGAQTQARILATDLSSQALEVAERATYTGRSVDPAPAMLRDRWFETLPSGSYTVKDQPRRLVELRRHNLVTDPPPFGPGEVDLIVCRNVTIYFGRETTEALIGRFHGLLAEGGYLLLGHSETLWQMSDAFSVVPVGDAFVYRRSQDTQPGATLPRSGRGGARRVVDAARSGARRAGVLPAVREVPADRPPVRRPATRGAPALLADARARLAAGEYAAAAGAAAQAVAADQLLAPAYVVLGQARATLGQDGAAIDALRKAVYLDPSAGLAHFLLAGALSRRGLRAAASASYRAAARTVEAMTPKERAQVLAGGDAAALAELCEQLAVEHSGPGVEASGAAPASGVGAQRGGS